MALLSRGKSAVMDVTKGNAAEKEIKQRANNFGGWTAVITGLVMDAGMALYEKQWQEFAAHHNKILLVATFVAVGGGIGVIARQLRLKSLRRKEENEQIPPVDLPFLVP
jgi:hypothetical protein